MKFVFPTLEYKEKAIDYIKNKDINIILVDVYPTGYDLILCRNVVIYFTDEAKDMIYANFFKSLKNKGVLFIGSTEQISNYKDLGFDRLSSFYFQKP